MKVRHRPPHLYLDNTYYFITSGTFHKKPYFNSHEKKELIREALFHAVNAYSYSLLAWVIFDNHYHLLIKTKIGALLP